LDSSTPGPHEWLRAGRAPAAFERAPCRSIVGAGRMRCRERQRDLAREAPPAGATERRIGVAQVLECARPAGLPLREAPDAEGEQSLCRTERVLARARDRKRFLVQATCA